MVGIDVVDIERLRGALRRSPQLEERLFTKQERLYCKAAKDPLVHLAGTLAAKEAVIKALKLGSLVAWARRIEIGRDDDGAPSACVHKGRETLTIGVSIAHDGPVAVAVALAASS